jgi:hypothetical protein
MGGAGDGGAGHGGAGMDSGGAGQSCTGIEDGAGEGGVGVCSAATRRIDTCCTGDADVHDTHYYYALPAAACGEARTCAELACYNDGCDDSTKSYALQARCCADGRWHSVVNDYQLVDVGDDDGRLAQSPLSPPCGGTALPSAHAVHLDGTTYLDLPTERATDTPSWELWFRTSAETGPLLTSDAPAYSLYLSSGKVCFYPSADQTEVCSPEDTFADGEWHHAAFAAGALSYPASLEYGGLYVDGTLRTAAQLGALGSVGSLRAGYGRVGSGSTSVYFTGELDEIRLWDTARDPFEIFDYLATRLVAPIARAHLVGYWPLEESGAAVATPNLGLLPSPPDGPSCSAFLGDVTGAAQATDATLVGTPSGSPWIEPGAF